MKFKSFAFGGLAGPGCSVERLQGRGALRKPASQGLGRVMGVVMVGGLGGTQPGLMALGLEASRCEGGL